MISPIAIATRGRISKSIKKTLTYATLGLLVITAEIPPTKTGGGSAIYKKRVQDTEKNILYSKILREDDEILTIIKIFLCQK